MDSPAKNNQALLMDIKYSLNELKKDIAGIKNELFYIKAHIHQPPITSPVIEPVVSTVEPAPGWFWSG
tara:strand:+ start:483 stop:686 length:204 start_codon:yes stop_codon:yes gene_type:complete